MHLGFHKNLSQWFIWNHDVYGWLFQQKWGSIDSNSDSDEDPFNLDELDEALDDVDAVEM
ncbi:hypothetical protein DVH05_000879 [Phytophthora capsici]|nr:hypothetical protein DVH05_000879 [Phytophthora capsici]